MSAPAAPASVAASPRTPASLTAFYRLLIRTLITVPRLLGIAGLGVLALLLGLFARFDGNSPQAAADAVSVYGLAILVPLACLWLGASAVGDLVEDRLLVYLFLKPVARWQLPAAAILATATIVVPLTAVPLMLSTVVAGAPEIAWPAFLAASLGALAYAGLFVAAGIWFRRAIWWGLAFILVWENAVANAAEGASRLTVVGWTSSVLALAEDLAEDVDVQLGAGSAEAALVVVPATAVAAWLLATWRYRRADID